MSQQPLIGQSNSQNEFFGGVRSRKNKSIMKASRNFPDDMENRITRIQHNKKEGDQTVQQLRRFITSIPDNNMINTSLEPKLQPLTQWMYYSMVDPSQEFIEWYNTKMQYGETNPIFKYLEEYQQEQRKKLYTRSNDNSCMTFKYFSCLDHQFFNENGFDTEYCNKFIRYLNIAGPEYQEWYLKLYALSQTIVEQTMTINGTTATQAFYQNEYVIYTDPVLPAGMCSVVCDKCGAKIVNTVDTLVKYLEMVYCGQITGGEKLSNFHHINCGNQFFSKVGVGIKWSQSGGIDAYEFFGLGDPTELAKLQWEVLPDFSILSKAYQISKLNPDTSSDKFLVAQGRRRKGRIFGGIRTNIDDQVNGANIVRRIGQLIQIGNPPVNNGQHPYDNVNAAFNSIPDNIVEDASSVNITTIRNLNMNALINWLSALIEGVFNPNNVNIFELVNREGFKKQQEQFDVYLQAIKNDNKLFFKDIFKTNDNNLNNIEIMEYLYKIENYLEKFTEFIHSIYTYYKNNYRILLQLDNPDVLLSYIYELMLWTNQTWFVISYMKLQLYNRKDTIKNALMYDYYSKCVHALRNIQIQGQNIQPDNLDHQKMLLRQVLGQPNVPDFIFDYVNNGQIDDNDYNLLRDIYNRFINNQVAVNNQNVRDSYKKFVIGMFIYITLIHDVEREFNIGGQNQVIPENDDLDTFVNKMIIQQCCYNLYIWLFKHQYKIIEIIGNNQVGQVQQRNQQPQYRKQDDVLIDLEFLISVICQINNIRDLQVVQNVKSKLQWIHNIRQVVINQQVNIQIINDVIDNTLSNIIDVINNQHKLELPTKIQNLRQKILENRSNKFKRLDCELHTMKSLIEQVKEFRIAHIMDLQKQVQCVCSLVQQVPNQNLNAAQINLLNNLLNQNRNNIIAVQNAQYDTYNTFKTNITLLQTALSAICKEIGLNHMSINCLQQIQHQLPLNTQADGQEDMLQKFQRMIIQYKDVYDGINGVNAVQDIINHAPAHGYQDYFRQQGLQYLMTYNILKFHMRDYVEIDANNNIIVDQEVTSYTNLNMGKLMNELTHGIIAKLTGGQFFVSVDHVYFVDSVDILLYLIYIFLPRNQWGQLLLYNDLLDILRDAQDIQDASQAIQDIRAARKAQDIRAARKAQDNLRNALRNVPNVLQIVPQHILNQQRIPDWALDKLQNPLQVARNTLQYIQNIQDVQNIQNARNARNAIQVARDNLQNTQNAQLVQNVQATLQNMLQNIHAQPRVGLSLQVAQNIQLVQNVLLAITNLQNTQIARNNLRDKLQHLPQQIEQQALQNLDQWAQDNLRNAQYVPNHILNRLQDNLRDMLLDIPAALRFILIHAREQDYAQMILTANGNNNNAVILQNLIICISFIAKYHNDNRIQQDYDTILWTVQRWSGITYTDANHQNYRFYVSLEQHMNNQNEWKIEFNNHFRIIDVYNIDPNNQQIIFTNNRQDYANEIHDQPFYKTIYLITSNDANVMLQRLQQNLHINTVYMNHGLFFVQNPNLNYKYFIEQDQINQNATIANKFFQLYLYGQNVFDFINPIYQNHQNQEYQQLMKYLIRDALFSQMVNMWLHNDHLNAGMQQNGPIINLIQAMKLQNLQLDQNTVQPWLERTRNLMSHIQNAVFGNQNQNQIGHIQFMVLQIIAITVLAGYTTKQGCGQSYKYILQDKYDKIAKLCDITQYNYVGARVNVLGQILQRQQRQQIIDIMLRYPILQSIQIYIFDEGRILNNANINIDNIFVENQNIEYTKLIKYLKLIHGQCEIQFPDQNQAALNQPALNAVLP